MKLRTMGARSMRVAIADDQIIGLYAYLKQEEEQLDPIVASVYILLQQELYNYLTIDQLERIEELHAANLRSKERQRNR